jgi:hypothetical protein
MANTLNNLMPDLYKALDVVSRELTGFITAVTLDAQVSRAALNQTVRSPVTTQGTAEDIAPGQLPPDTGDQTIGNTPIVITKSRCVPFRWSGEEQLSMNSGGPGYLTIQQNQIAQAIRVLANEVEAFVGGQMLLMASRATGTSGTTPFGSAIDPLADIVQILDDNGCPVSDRQCVLNTTAVNKMRKLTNLYKVNEAGNEAFLRQGTLQDLFGLRLSQSAGVAKTVAGTGSGYLVNNAGPYAVGTTTIACDTGTGTIKIGDVVTFAGDTNQYVVTTALAAGSFSIGSPGLRQTLADNVAITVTSAYTANMAFSRSAFILATRPPAIPEEGDMATDATLVTDERTGLTFEVRMYAQYRRIRYEICLAYGGAGIKPDHTSILKG